VANKHRTTGSGLDVDSASGRGGPAAPRVAAVLSSRLRQLRRERGLTQRDMVVPLHLAAHSAVADFESGRRVPAVDILGAYERFFGLAPGSLTDLRQQALAERAAQEAYRPPDPYAGVAPAIPPQPVRDGADPDAAGCHDDAQTVHARKIGMTGRSAILGQVELRYSPARHAAWGRFLGYDTVKHLAQRHSVEVLVAVERVPDGTRLEFRDVYWFDYHWCDLLATAGHAGPVQFAASATLFLDGVAAGTGTTDRLPLR
jgi:transcriptional regulator with XRE-family HTH domain